jgi:hypothetical protein
MPAYDHGATGYQPNTPRQRVVSAAMSIGVILLALLLALLQTTINPPAEKQKNPTTFDISGEPNKNSGGEKPQQKRAEEKPTAKSDTKTVPVPPVPRPVEQPKVKEPVEPAFIKLSRKEFAAGDIGSLPPAAGSGTGAKGRNSSASAYGPGEGPGGVQLFDAEWYRKPTDAQLAGYMPKSAPGEGWGLVACRTIEDYRVEDCQILGESPRGSGYGRAVQNAAWQFLVRPPRIDSKPQVGTWVRIRITYSARGIEG